MSLFGLTGISDTIKTSLDDSVDGGLLFNAAEILKAVDFTKALQGMGDSVTGPVGKILEGFSIEGLDLISDKKPTVAPANQETPSLETR